LDNDPSSGTCSMEKRTAASDRDKAAMEKTEAERRIHSVTLLLRAVAGIGRIYLSHAAESWIMRSDAGHGILFRYVCNNST